jgi:hypothetical protein
MEMRRPEFVELLAKVAGLLIGNQHEALALAQALKKRQNQCLPRLLVKVL